MPDVHLYVSDLAYEKIKAMAKGEPSALCNQAILDHFHLRVKSSDEIRAELKNATNDKELIEKKIEFINNRLKEAVEREEEEQKKKEKENLKEQKSLIDKEHEKLRQKIKRYVDWVFTFNKCDDEHREEITQLATAYANNLNLWKQYKDFPYYLMDNGFVIQDGEVKK